MNKIIKLLIFGVFVVVAGFFLFSGSSEEVAISKLEPRQNSNGEPIKIIAFGDSLTAGYGLPLDQSYPAQLERKLIERGLNVKVINSGVSGETTRGNLERAEFIREQKPDIVLLGIGGNDALRLLKNEEIRANIENTILILKDTEDPPVIVMLEMQAPINAGLAYKQSFDKIYTDLAKKHDLILLPFITLEVFSNKEFKQQDGIHFNQAGYNQIIDLYLLDPLTDIIEKISE